MKLAFLPVAKNAPPRPRRFAAFSSSITQAEACARAFAGASWPPTARYPAIFVRSRPSAPASTTTGVLGTPQLLQDRGNVLRQHRLPVVVVDGDDRGPAAAAEALDRPQRHL